ncbi:hypothetical protein [Streptomyces sp. NPDC058674]|uniref:hypothetical protein n=1 Tax=Streptomyces sp. NPDC058674 TaxID=3346592 RepID=UPI00365510E6
MLDHSGPGRDLRSFALPESGQLLATGDVWEPYRLVDQHGLRVEPVAVYFKDLLAADTPATTLRSYGNDLLRWWRFLWALDIEWDRAVREDARDFMLWMHLAGKPVRVHWRRRDTPTGDGRPALKAAPAAPVPGSPNPVTGKPTIGTKYAASTRAHCETVLRTFYDFHLASNSGSLLMTYSSNSEGPSDQTASIDRSAWTRACSASRAFSASASRRPARTSVPVTPPAARIAKTTSSTVPVPVPIFCLSRWIRLSVLYSSPTVHRSIQTKGPDSPSSPAPSKGAA